VKDSGDEGDRGGNVRGASRGLLIRNSLVDNLAFLNSCASAQLRDNVAIWSVIEVVRAAPASRWYI
jgi:hypothetical protein